MTQVRARIEGGLTTATERLYNAAKKALGMVADYEPDTRMTDGLAAAYKAADAAVKPQMQARADAYREQLAAAVSAYEKRARAAKGTPWAKFPKLSLPPCPEIVGSAGREADGDHTWAAYRGDVIRRNYASGVPTSERRRGGGDGSWRDESRSHGQSRSRSR